MQKSNPLLPPVPEMQAVASISAALTQNQWYDLWTGLACDAGAGSIKKNVELIMIGAYQETANETLEVRVIADDFDSTADLAVTHSTAYTIITHYNGALVFETGFLNMFRYITCKARSLQIMIRKTTATGANPTNCHVLHAQH